MTKDRIAQELVEITFGPITRQSVVQPQPIALTKPDGSLIHVSPARAAKLVGQGRAIRA